MATGVSSHHLPIIPGQDGGDALADAHRLSEEGHPRGKVVVTV